MEPTSQSSSIDLTYNDVNELHYITAIKHLPSILKVGIWCHNKVDKVRELDVSNNDIQDRRADKGIPRAVEGRNSLTLHDHVNLYFNAHNAMMYNQLEKNLTENICVLRISKEVLNFRHTVVANQNAATDGAEFEASVNYFDPAAKKIHILKAPILNAGSMGPKGNLDSQTYRQKRQAEVLIPYMIPPKCIKGIYVCSQKVKNLVLEMIGDKNSIYKSVTICSSLIPVPGSKQLPYYNPSMDSPLSPITSPLQSPHPSPPPSPTRLQASDESAPQP